MKKFVAMSFEDYEAVITYLDAALNELYMVSPTNFSIGETERRIQMAKDILTKESPL